MSSEEVGDLILAVWRRWKSASPVGRGALTQEQYWILKTLNEESHLKVKELASTIGCTPGSASVALKRLEKAGYVTRERSEDDERVVKVGLSKKGSEKLAEWKSEQLRSMSSLFDALEDRERETLRELLSRALVSRGAGENPPGGGR